MAVSPLLATSRYLYTVNSRLLNFTILVSLALIWGSSFILMNRGLQAFTYDQVAAYRIFIAFVFVLPLAPFHLKKELASNWKAFLGNGLFGNFIPAFLFTHAETGISSALTGMLNSLTPLFTLLIGISFFQTSTTWTRVAGVLAGLAGAVGLLYAGSGANDFSRNAWFGGFVVIATICYGLSVNIIKRYLNNINSVSVTVWALCFIGPPAGLYLFTTDFLHRLMTDPCGWSSLFYTSILGIVGTAISVILFTRLIKNTNALFASSVTYLIPIVAIAWGAWFGEDLKLLHFLFMALILTGVWLVNRKKVSA
jgi:drug/metabolite transporter (DMT)-like permease